MSSIRVEGLSLPAVSSRSLFSGRVYVSVLSVSGRLQARVQSEKMGFLSSETSLSSNVDLTSSVWLGYSEDTAAVEVAEVDVAEEAVATTAAKEQ